MDLILAILSALIDHLMEFLAVLIPTAPSCCWPATLLIIVIVVLIFPSQLTQLVANHGLRVKVPFGDIEIQPSYGPSLSPLAADEPTTEKVPRVIPIHQAYALGGLLMVLANSIGFGATNQKIKQQIEMARQLARNVRFTDDSLTILDAIERDTEKGAPNEPMDGARRVLNVERAHVLATELNDELWEHVQIELHRLPQNSLPSGSPGTKSSDQVSPTDPKDS